MSSAASTWDDLPPPPTVEEVERALVDPVFRSELRHRLGADQSPDPELVRRAEQLVEEQQEYADEQIRRHMVGEPNDFRPVQRRR